MNFQEYWNAFPDIALLIWAEKQVSKITPILRKHYCCPSFIGQKNSLLPFITKTESPIMVLKLFPKNYTFWKLNKCVGNWRLPTYPNGYGNYQGSIAFLQKNALFYQYLQAYALQFYNTPRKFREAIHKII